MGIYIVSIRRIKMNNEIIMDTCIDYNNEIFDNEACMERVPFKILIDGE